MNLISSTVRRSPAVPTAPSQSPHAAVLAAAAAVTAVAAVASPHPRNQTTAANSFRHRQRCSIRPPDLIAWVQKQHHPQPRSRAPSQATSFETPTSAALRQGLRGLTASRMPSSDDEYAAFLERANETAAPTGTSSAAGHARDKNGFTASSVDTPVPTALSSVEAYYTSESDERFEAVSLKLREDVESISADIVKSLTGYKEVESVPLGSFDPRGEYQSVIDAVKKASDGQTQVFRIELGGARCEYWVLGLDSKDGKLVGMRAGAIES